MARRHIMLFAAHVDVATLAHDEDGQGCEQKESDEQFSTWLFSRIKSLDAEFLRTKLTAG